MYDEEEYYFHVHIRWTILATILIDILRPIWFQNFHSSYIMIQGDFENVLFYTIIYALFYVST